MRRNYSVFSLSLSPAAGVNGEMLYKLKKKDGGEG